MLTLKDGPVAGSYMVKRAPLWLRGVIAQDGTKDVLDQLNDEPHDDEEVYVYRRVGDVGHVHLNMADRRRSGFYVRADYLFVPVEGHEFRCTAEWQRWVSERADEPSGVTAEEA